MTSGLLLRTPALLRRRLGRLVVTVSARRDAPSPILALVSGRERIEVSHAETVESLAWAEQIDGWEPALRVHPHDPRVNDR